MAEEKEYTVIPEAKEIIKSLAERYPKILWTVRPEVIEVLGVTNKERPKSSKKVMQIRKVTGAYKALLLHKGVNTEYIIEMFCSDWQPMSNSKRAGFIWEELLKIPGPDESGMIKTDVDDFALNIDAFGLDWQDRADLPNLLEGDLIPFKEELSVRLHKKDEEEPQPSE